MQKLFGSRSQAIQLSSDDEDDFVGSSNSLSSGFGCVSCLPRFSMMGGNGTIRIPEEDATLEDYLDPNTTTTIEPLLEEYNNQQSDNAFNGAALQDSQRFLTRNPFASSTAKPTTITTNNLSSTQHTFETSNDNGEFQYESYQEQQQHSFAGALPRVDFFLENDENDAEFLSDHRISAVIGDSSKLTSQFELFAAQDKTGQLLQDDHIQPSDLAAEDGQGEQGDEDDDIATEMEAAQPFEIQNDWNEDALDMHPQNSDTQQEQQNELDSDSKQQQPQHTEMKDADGTLTDISTPAKMITREFDNLTTSPINDNNNNNNQTTDGTAGECKPPVDPSSENTSANKEMYTVTKKMKSMTLSPGNNDSKTQTFTHDDLSFAGGEASTMNMGLPFPSTSTEQPAINNNTRLTDMEQDVENDNEATEQNTNMLPTSDSLPTIPSSPPSPIPTLSTENAQHPFPSPGLSRAPVPVQNIDVTPVPPAKETSERTDPYQQSKDHDKTNSITPDNDANTTEDGTSSSNSDSNNANQLSAGSANDEAKMDTITSDGKRRSSVAAVAHSLLGDKLDDFTEKLAYIRKNIIMSLDDDDDDSDDYYNEDISKARQQHQHQQLRRSRSGSMQQDIRRQSFDPSVSILSGNVHQQQRRQLTRADTTDGPRTHHRRSNSLMDGANSFAKIFQQMGGQHEEEPNQQRHFSPSSFFASLAGPDIPSTSSSPAGSAHPASPLPQKSSSMSSPGHQQQQLQQQQHQYPAVSRSATQLHTTHQSSSHVYNGDPFLQNVSEEENIDEEDLFDFSKMIAMGKNVRNISEDLMGNGIRLFNDFSTRMKNANASRMAALEQSSSSNTTTNVSAPIQQQQGHYHRQPQPQQEHQTSSMDQEFLLGDTYI